MGFADNLRKKIEIDRKVDRLLTAWGPAGSGRRIDKEIVRSLLEAGGFSHEQTRDLDLYFLQPPGPDGRGRILVLDNELPIFDTTADDVAMRRSPTVKEMVSIRNAIKILNDKDIVVSKREESLKRLQKMLIDGLDLSYTASDIEGIAAAGAASLGRDYTEGVEDSLDLFAEMLGYSPAPKALEMAHFVILGAAEKGAAGEVRFGPAVLYSRVRNELKLLEETVSSGSKSAASRIEAIAAGEEPATVEGEEVFSRLKEKVLEGHPEIG